MPDADRFIRIAIMSNHAMVWEGIEALLARPPDSTMIGEKEDRAETVGCLAALSPDVR
jgi:DNA-binding NarL/FixJ family response regulator